MSYYYNYSFISPEEIYANIKEELKSYFDTGAVDDLMFPVYVNKCLNKLGRSSYPLLEEMMYLEDYQSRLPDNFHAVREAWFCAEIEATPYQTGSSFYSQTASTTIQISPLTTGETPCAQQDCAGDPCADNCLPDIIQAVYKTNHEATRYYRREYLLKPGNISARQNCDVSYTNTWSEYGTYNCETNSGCINDYSSYGDNPLSNPYSSSFDSFDIRDNKFVTTFRTGTVYLIFYATDYDGIGNQLVPDNYRVKEFIESFLKYKMFETLTNQCNDETFNQLQQKMIYYKAIADESYIMAEIEIKKQTVHEKQRRIKQTLNRHNMYDLPTFTSPYGRRRNN